MSLGVTIGEWLIENGLETRGIKRKKKNSLHKYPLVGVAKKSNRLPKIRYGKQAFVKGLPYYASFSRNRALTPEFQVWSEEEWLKLSESKQQCEDEEVKENSEPYKVLQAPEQAQIEEMTEG